jgi:protein-arginine kinase activator protein McsA
MAKKCLECGKKKKVFAYNYAGFIVNESLVLPGNKKKDFLCVECANKPKVTCVTHGPIHGRIEFGIVPTCQKCSHQKCPECERQVLVASNRVTLDGFLDKGQQAFLKTIGNEQVHLKCPHCGATFVRIT